MSAYANSPANILTRIHGMLEFDSVSTNEEFVLMITEIHFMGGIPIEQISSHIGTTPDRIHAWMKGEAIPEPAFMPTVVKKVMSLIQEVLDEIKYKRD